MTSVRCWCTIRQELACTEAKEQHTKRLMRLKLKRHTNAALFCRPGQAMYLAGAALSPAVKKECQKISRQQSQLCVTWAQHGNANVRRSAWPAAAYSCAIGRQHDRHAAHVTCAGNAYAGIMSARSKHKAATSTQRWSVDIAFTWHQHATQSKQRRLAQAQTKNTATQQSSVAWQLLTAGKSPRYKTGKRAKPLCDCISPSSKPSACENRHKKPNRNHRTDRM